ncbi:BMP family ABC transporter substrate-binding protein [Streptomyces sp. NPDC093261]|uniref:BMP family ABC transporter substrate-binding protein n=1 Tax=Streptomyces sp. NPDC093261 TaxID=3366037 RepID=UPI00382A4E8C
MAAVGALVAAGLLVWLAVALLTGPGTPKIVANNISRNFRACLINGQQDASMAQPVWSSLQKAASGAAVNAQHIQVPKGSTAASLPYVNSLVQRRCGLIISVGPELHDAVATAARHNPHQRFITMGPAVKLPNVRNFSPVDRPAVISAVQQAANPRPSRRA